MNYILKIFHLTLCKIEFNCFKCKKFVKVNTNYMKYDNGINYDKLCFKCYRKEIIHALKLLNKELVIIT